MPPFRLELPDKNVAKREPRVFFTKNNFQPAIKITDWEKHQEGLPIDKDPYCPGNLDYFLSHYNRIGNGPDEPLSTTVQIMLNQAYDKTEVELLHHIPYQYMINYFTYKDTLACETDYSNKLCPELCATSYLTTNQESYTPPYPYKMERFSFPTIPFLINRAFRWKQFPDKADSKFMDDELCQQIQQIKKTKGAKTKSYDPGLASYTDGTLAPERKLGCFKLEYQKGN